jgi:hypothetical protein
MLEEHADGDEVIADPVVEFAHEERDAFLGVREFAGTFDDAGFEAFLGLADKGFGGAASGRLVLCQSEEPGGRRGEQRGDDREHGYLPPSGIESGGNGRLFIALVRDETVQATVRGVECVARVAGRVKRDRWRSLGAGKTLGKGERGQKLSRRGALREVRFLHRRDESGCQGHHRCSVRRGCVRRVETFQETIERELERGQSGDNVHVVLDACAERIDRDAQVDAPGNDPYDQRARENREPRRSRTDTVGCGGSNGVVVGR